MFFSDPADTAHHFECQTLQKPVSKSSDSNWFFSDDVWNEILLIKESYENVITEKYGEDKLNHPTVDSDIWIKTIVSFPFWIMDIVKSSRHNFLSRLGVSGNCQHMQP